MKIRKIFIFSSFLFNIIIVFGIIYLLLSTSFSANIENENDAHETKNFDSINKVNRVKLIEMSPKELEFKIEKLSKNKSCMVVFWASWCKYCPELIKIIDKLKSDQDYDFNLILVSLDKPNLKGKESVLKKIALLNLKNEQYITSINDYFDISNSKVIYKYIIDKREFDKNPGFPHFQIFKNNIVIYEGTGYDNIYGVSKYISHLIKK